MGEEEEGKAWVSPHHPPSTPSQTNPDFEFLYGGDGSAYWDYALARAIALEEGEEEGGGDDGGGDGGANDRGAGDGRAGDGGAGDGGAGAQSGAVDNGAGAATTAPPPPPPPPPPPTDPLALPSPAGLIPELITAAATQGAPRHAPIPAAAAAAASARAAGDPPPPDPPPPYIQAKLRLLLARLDAYAPGVTAADVCGNDVGRTGGGGGGGPSPPRRYRRGSDRAGLGHASGGGNGDAHLDAVFASWRSARSASYHSGVAAFVAEKREAELGG